MGILAKNDLVFADMLAAAIYDKNLEAGAKVLSALQAFISKPRTVFKKKIMANYEKMNDRQANLSII